MVQCVWFGGPTSCLKNNYFASVWLCEAFFFLLLFIYISLIYYKRLCFLCAFLMLAKTQFIWRQNLAIDVLWLELTILLIGVTDQLNVHLSFVLEALQYWAAIVNWWHPIVKSCEYLENGNEVVIQGGNHNIIPLDESRCEYLCKHNNKM